MSYNLDIDEYGFPKEIFIKPPSKESLYEDTLEEADNKGKSKYENKINNDSSKLI